MSQSYKAYIPYGAYWSTPFAKWQGSFADLHAVKFAAHVTKSELQKRDISPAAFDHGVLGVSVPQHQSFYGTPWYMGLIGAGEVSGPTVAQACATGARSVLSAVQEIESGLADTTLVTTADRTSNGPHVFYPAPGAPGGTGTSENWVMDNFGCDPLGRHSMTQTAENAARKHQLTTEEQHDVVLMRQEQYQAAIADDHAFQKRYMTLPFDVPTMNFKKSAGALDGDEGIVTSTAEGLGRLRPVLPDGTVTFGGQTHPADGNASVVVTTKDRAKEFSSNPNIEIRVLGFGQHRVDLAYMPEAPAPAAQKALDQAGLKIADIDGVTTHNPFAVNDLIFARETGFPLQNMNRYGCSLIWGHPQGPTGLRAIIELIEDLAQRGGGKGLFTGCAAGDTAMSVVLEVSDAA